MTSTRDVKDMLGLSGQQAAPTVKPSKKSKKAGEKRHGDGMWNKEIRSLIGERAPPTILIDHTPQLKQKRHLARSGPVRCWQSRLFKNDSRTDDLLLRHWRRTEDISRPYDRAGAGEDAVNGEPPPEKKPIQLDEGQYRFAQFNHQVTAQTFDHETYETHLKKEGWTEGETRYLTDLYADFYGKWHVIWDRYEWPLKDEQTSDAKGDPMQVDSNQSQDLQEQPQINGTTSPPSTTEEASRSASQPAPPSPPSSTVQRTLEDLKSRFYTVTATLLALSTPPQKMNTAQYAQHETLLKYSPSHEVTRKAQKAKQMTRTPAEKREEDFLIAELKRIYFGQERADAELREIRGRLDHSLTDDRNPVQAYAGSREIQELFNRVVKADPRGATKARRSLEGGPGVSIAAPSPTTANQNNRKGTTATTPGTADSMSNAASNVRQLSPRAALRAGLTTHERLTSGIAFRSDRIAKVRAPSKSTPVNTKIGAILVELGIPEGITMPTVATVDALEELVKGVEELVKRRAEREKVVADAKVGAEVGKLLTEEGGQKKESDAMETEPEANVKTEEGEQEGDNQSGMVGAPAIEKEASTPAPAIAPTAPSAATRTRNKRSASVLSASSTGSGRPGGPGPKRQKSVRKQ